MATIVEDIDTAAAGIAVALASSGYDADLSPASLWEIDRFFDEQAPDGRARRRGLLGQQVGARLFALGAYVGEVLRRELGGEWHGDDDDPEAEITVELRLPDGSVVWPVQRVLQRFRDGPEEGIAAYGSALGLTVGPRPERPDPPEPPVRRGWLRRRS
jgi:hypothetical protein